MKRRSLLGWLPRSAAGFSLLAVGLGQPGAASALGGILPALDQPAPPFRLDGVAPPSGGGGDPQAVSLGLDDFRRRWLVLYFYPRDFTSGCTLEARGFQRDLATYHRLGAEVVGISTDSAASHGSFCGEEGLSYPLLSDPQGSVCRLYGSWLAPSALRHTFLIDPDGNLRARWVAVRPLNHSSEVLQTLEQLQSAPLT